MPDEKLIELEKELERLRTEQLCGFPLHPQQELEEKVKGLIRQLNFSLLCEFIKWLNESGINLLRCSHDEKGILFRMFGKERDGMSRTQTERNTKKETSKRSF